MKKKSIFFLAIIILITYSSCEKMEFRKDISGTWKSLFAGSGYSPHDIKVNYTLLRLKSNNRYYIYNYDTLKASGKYSIYDSGYENNKYYEPFYINFEKGSTFDSKLTFQIDKNLDVSIINNDTIGFSLRKIADGEQYFFTRSK